MKSSIFYAIAIVIFCALIYFGLDTDKNSFIGSLFAAFVSVFVVVFVEMELRPRIKLIEESPTHKLKDGRRILRVIVENSKLWWPLNLIMDRRPAYQVKAWITFLTDSNDLIFTKGRDMIGRWASAPEPIRPISLKEASDGKTQLAYLWDLSLTDDAIDIGSGSKEFLDIVMRGPNEEGCFGWHNRIIQNPNVNPEDKFNLQKGRYRALVRVETSGRIYKALFRIVCDVGIEDFRLEPINGIPKGL